MVIHKDTKRLQERFFSQNIGKAIDEQRKKEIIKYDQDHDLAPLEEEKNSLTPEKLLEIAEVKNSRKR